MIYPRCRLMTAVILLLAAIACSKNDTPTSPTPSCTVSTGAISASTFSASGGTGSVAVTAGSTCAWTSTSSAAFVAITAGSSGTGNGTTTFAVAANTGAARTATLTVAGTAFTISQAAAGTPAPSTPGSLSAPVATSPIGGAAVTVARPPLVVTNATASGTVGTVTYRFEISDQPTFPNDAVRTFSVDGVAQGSGSTTGTVPRDLGANVLWYWHARATDGTVTSAYSATETFSTGNPCSYALSATSATLNNAGGTGSVTVTTTSGCAWTATSNDAFITVTAGGSVTGTGTVSYNVATNSGGTRTGTITIAGQTFTITQSGSAGIAVSFQLTDPAAQSGPTTECRFRSATSAPTTCTLQSTSFTLGANTIASYSWTVQYTYDSVKTITGSSSTLAITDVCGGNTSTADGAAQPLSVSLTVTDNLGGTATATSGTGSQPALQVRLFTCGS